VRAAAFAALWVAPACQTVAFSSQFGDNDPARVSAALARIGGAGDVPKTASRPTNAAGVPLVVAAVRGPQPGIVAYDVEAGKTLWTQPADVRSRIVVAPAVAVCREGKGALVARSLASGAVRWRAGLPANTRLLGVAADGAVVVYVTEGEGARVEGREVAAVTALSVEDGALRWRAPATGRLGAPAILGGVVLVPFAHQYLALLDARTGREVGRVRNRDQEIEFVVPTPEGVFYGSSGLYRLDRKAVRGSAAESTYTRAALPDEFVRASYAGDGYNAAQAQYTAYDRNRLLWRADSDGRRFRDGVVVLHTYRFVFAMDAAGAGLRWAYAWPGEDLVASAHVGAALLLVSARGDAVVLDATTGAQVLARSIGVPVAGATIDAEGFAPAKGTVPPADLHETLTEIIWDPDRRFEQVKLFAVDELSRGGDRRVIESLIRIVTHDNVDRRVHERAAATLVERIGADALPALRHALAVRTDYLAGVRARGVDALAGAAARLGAAELVPLLAAHLEDAETPVGALGAVAAALVAIGDRSAAEPLARFVLDHRADEALEAHPEALRAAVDGLARLGTPVQRQLLAFVAGDLHTRPFLRATIRERMSTSGGARSTDR
jgi:hypothetical protein